MSEPVKWIDLNDPSGARLKLASVDVDGKPVSHLFITNLSWRNPKWRHAMRLLGFREPPSKRYLVRRIVDGERLTLRQFRDVFPQARMTLMSPESYILGFGKEGNAEETRRPQIDLRGVSRLGRNSRGHQVYESLSGRFFVDEESGRRVDEGDGSGHNHEDFLRLSPSGVEPPTGPALHAALTRLAHGLVQSMRRGETLHNEDIDTWIRAVWAEDSASPQDVAERHELVFRALDNALLRALRDAHDTPALAFGEAARLHAYQPAYHGALRSAAAMPLPLAIVAQRLLGDTANKTVVVPNVWDGAIVAFLGPGCDVRAYQVQTARHLDQGGADGLFRLRDEDYSPTVCAAADALLLNADPLVDELGQREDYRLALLSLRQLRTGARAVLVFAGDDEHHPGSLSVASLAFMRQIAQRYVIDDCWETAPVLSRKNGGVRGLRLIALRAEAPDGERVEQQLKLLERPLPVFASWDAVKSHVDEVIETIRLAEAQSAQSRLEREEEGDYQRPYMAFSRIGEARTMVPANLAAPVQQYLTEIEERFGSVDEFVSRELGMGINTMMARFSPEQVDGIAVMLSRLMIGRSSILADDTGIGKGRQLAALAVWANKRGEDVYFVTDRANLFSDLARDLNDIGEWGRFAPLVFNADGEITVDAGPGEPPRVLAKGEPAASLRRMIEEGLTLRDLGRNICFLTYSQINQEESEKARWLKNNVSSGLVIFDEAHIASGSDSNIARHVSEIAAAAKHVQFASATWAKTPDNLHIYQRAFPTSVSVSTLAETMRRGGESFSEIFSAMLAAEGALIRREHDLSRLEVELVIDEQNRDRNEFVSDKIADVIGAAAYLAGEMEQVFIRTNADSVRRLREARRARDEVAPPKQVRLFSTNFGSGSVIYQIMKGVQGALNAEHVARLAIESLRKGLKPVIVTDSTGERLLEKVIERDQVQQAMSGQASAENASNVVRMPTLRDLLRDVLLRRLMTVRVREVDSDEVLRQEDAELAHARSWNNGQDDESLDVESARIRAQQSAGDALEVDGLSKPRVRYQEVSVYEVMTPDLLEIYERGIEEIKAKIEAVPDIAVNAIDVIEQALRDAGYRVGEITGRKYQLVKQDGQWLMYPRITHKKAVKAAIKSFNDGAIDALVINRAAAAGVSLHASPRFGDRSRRHLIEHMIPEDPVSRIQLLGRVNRFDQLSSPLITTASTGIYGEVRYLMMQNKKLARLSANVRSSRENAMSLKGVVDLFNPIGAKAVRSYLADSPLVARRLGLPADSVDDMPDIVNRVTMRIPLLTVAQQRQVYDEIYSRFEEMLVRAELDGQNPLKPGELDVRAKVEEETVFIGDDADEHVSAFDAPVYVRRLAWEETLSPLTWDSVKTAALVSRERLLEEKVVEVVESGNTQAAVSQNVEAAPNNALLAFADRPDVVANVPRVRLSQNIAKLVKNGFEGMLRLAHTSSGIEDIHEAVTGSLSVYRAATVYHWIKENIDKLVPGAGIHWVSEETHLHDEQIITNVEVPKKQEELLHLGKWKITAVSAGHDRAHVFSLRSILSDVKGTPFRGEFSQSLNMHLRGPVLNEGIYGGRARMLAHSFEFAPRGKRVRRASMLSGNLYLASEWAAATGKGHAVIYTDENGTRHRGILLPQDIENVRPEFLPVRVADPLAQTILLNSLLTRSASTDALPENARNALMSAESHALDLTFKSALQRIRGLGHESVIVIVPGSGIGISMAPQDMARVAGAIKSAQNALMKKHGLAAESDPGYFRVRQFSRVSRSVSSVFARAVSGIRVSVRALGLGLDESNSRKERGAGLLLLELHTPEQANRAIKILTESAGLEIYAAEQPYRALAQNALRESMRARRQQMREAQEMAQSAFYRADAGQEDGEQDCQHVANLV